MTKRGGPKLVAWGGYDRAGGAPLPPMDPFDVPAGQTVVRLEDAEIVGFDGEPVKVAVYETRSDRYLVAK